MTLDRPFASYIEIVSRTFADARASTTGKKGKLQLVGDNIAVLRRLIDQIERGSEFNKLVEETSSAFSKDYHGKSKGGWEDSVQNFFRRSEYYLDVWEGRIPNKQLIFNKYCEAFERRHRTITYLGLLEFVQFAERCMDFGSFEVRRFKASELREILQTSVNKVFFPWAATEADQLASYWFIYLKEQTQAPQIGKISINLNEVGRLRLDYTAYPKAVEFALYPLVLFEWERDWWKVISGEGQKREEKDLESGWNRFHVPFLIRLDDNLLVSPGRAPDVSRLETVPDFDPQTNEEIGEVPLVLVDLNEGQTDLLKTFVKNATHLLANLRAGENDWQFFDIALGYFIKAFCAEGFEQLLWHITTLEALLGEKGEGVTEKLARRSASILGKTNQEQKALRQQFRELYDFRSTLVHGGNFKKQVYVGHLREARSLARRTLLWFLHFLSNLQRGVSEGRLHEKIPTRQEILTIMDIDQKSRGPIGELMRQLPETFPYVPQWIE